MPNGGVQRDHVMLLSPSGLRRVAGADGELSGRLKGSNSAPRRMRVAHFGALSPSS